MNSLTRQLIRASLPARRAVLRRRLGRVVLEEVDGLSLVILPEVFNPVVFRTGVLLARTAVGKLAGAEPPPTNAPLPATQRPDDLTVQRPAVLDMGTGSGIGALFAARAGCSVTAVDVNPEAVRCARINAMMNHLEEHVEVLEGDLFAPASGREFDLVLFNPPFFRGAPKDKLDRAWRANDVLERFALGLPASLAPGGRSLTVFSSDGDEEGLLEAFEKVGLATSVAARRDFGNEVVTVYESRCEATP